MKFREHLAIRIIGLASYALPANHRALLLLHFVAAFIEGHYKDFRFYEKDQNRSRQKG
jgi:hypothetical protein